MRILIVGVAMVVLAGVAAGADTPPDTPGGPCAADIGRFCRDTEKGDGRLRACLLAHEKDLASACRARIGGTGATGPAMGAQQLLACQADLAKHCAEVPSGGGRLRACLQEHADAVTPACKAALARGPEPQKPSPAPTAADRAPARPSVSTGTPAARPD